MRGRSFLLFALITLVSLAGFLAGWLFRDGPSPRALASAALVAGVVFVSGGIAALRESPRR